MTVRSKILLIFCGALGALVLLLYVVSRIILLTSFARLEEELMDRNVARARDLLFREVSELDYITRDWAWWDETYVFVKNRNEFFVKSNLNDVTIGALKVSALLFIDSSGEVIFSTGFDERRNACIPLPQEMYQEITKSRLLLRHTDMRGSVAGILSCPGGPLLVSSRPVLTGDGKGPIRGTLIMGRLLDAAKINEMAQLLHMSVCARMVGDSLMPLDFREVRSSLSAASPQIVRPLSSHSIAGYAFFNDIYGKPAIILRVDMPRDISARGQAAVLYSIVSYLVVGLLFGVTIVLLLQRVVLSRLKQLSSRVERIGTTGDISARVVLKGKDELARLAGAINGMLVALEGAQHNLRRSEENYRALFENMLSGFAYHKIVVDERGQPVDFVFLEVNGPFEKFTRLRKGDIIGRRASEVMPGIKSSDFDWVGLYGRVALTGETAHVERYSDFLGRWYAISAYSTRRGYFAIVYDDITERKLVEQALRESQRQQKAILDNIPDIAWLKDRESKFIAVNEAFGRACGVKPEDLVGRTDHDIWPKDLAERYRADDAEVMRSGMRKCVEEPLVDAGGVMTWIETIKTPIYDDKGNVIGTTGIARDIMERKKTEERRRRTEEALRESEEKYRTLYANVPVGLYRNTSGPHGKFLIANQAIARMFGYSSPEEFMTCKVSDLYVDPGERKAFSDLIMAQGRVSGVELRLKKKDGMPIWGSVSASVVRDPHGGVVYFDGMIEDITARKQAEEDLRKTAEDLKRSNQDLEQFACVASHDLQEPLRMVTNYLQLLERRYKDKIGEDGGEFIAYAMEGAARMKNLINDLLEFSRVGTSERPFTAVDSAAAFRNALSNLEVTIKESGASVTHDPLPMVNADEKQLVQLFQNLVANAIKFRSAEAPRIQVSASQKGSEWIFSVRDNGIGIDPRFAGRIFVLFQRLHGKEEYPGTGIGLALCRKIVERHGGRIWMESAPGKGATFFFTLPKKGGRRQ